MIWETHLGSFRLVAIEDGWFYRSPLEMFPASDEEEWNAHPDYLQDGMLRVSIGCYLVSGPDGHVMVDTGAGLQSNRLPDGTVSGRMPSALTALGVDREDVRAVVHTHLHIDHFGGDLVDDSPFFPNAHHYVHRAEVDYWLHRAAGKAAQSVEEGFAPLIAQRKVIMLDGPSLIVPGMTATETFGHTPGHLAVDLSYDDLTAVIAGDVTHHPLQVDHPEWNVAADVDPDQAVATRARLFDHLTGSDMLVAAGHYPRPSFGRIGMVAGHRVFVFDPGAREG